MVHLKLQQARVALAKQPLKKSGLNKHLGFQYFELGDFLPAIQNIFADLKLCGRTWFDHTTAYLAIYDGEKPESFVVFSSPTAQATLNKGTPIQELGSMHTYMRRYLWLMAMEISENDLVDAEAGDVRPAESKPKAEKKPAPPATAGKEGQWQMNIRANEGSDSVQWTEELNKLLDLTLSFATTASDVNEIFRVNRKIFDTLKSQDDMAYEGVLSKFKTAKQKFEEK